MSDFPRNEQVFADGAPPAVTPRVSDSGIVWETLRDLAQHATIEQVRLDAAVHLARLAGV